MPQNLDKRRVNTERGHCPECGGQVEGGRGGCQALFDEITYGMSTDPNIAVIHRLALDTYCMQHVESYCESAKSYAAHLMGLCCGIEHGDEPALYAPINRMLNANVKLAKPPVLSNRGSVTLSDVMVAYHASGSTDELVKRVHEWARDVWGAYSSQHEIAWMWLKMKA